MNLLGFKMIIIQFKSKCILLHNNLQPNTLEISLITSIKTYSFDYVTLVAQSQELHNSCHLDRNSAQTSNIGMVLA